MTAKSRIKVNSQQAVLDMQHVDLLHEVASIVPETGADLDLVHLSCTGVLDIPKMLDSNSSLAHCWRACEASVMNDIANKQIAAIRGGRRIEQGECLLGHIVD